MKCGDGFAACINGKRIASSNTPAKLSWNSKAEDKVNDGKAVEFRSVILESGASALKTGTNVIAVQALNNSHTSSDFLLDTQLRGRSLPPELRCGIPIAQRHWSYASIIRAPGPRQSVFPFQVWPLLIQMTARAGPNSSEQEQTGMPVTRGHYC